MDVSCSASATSADSASAGMASPAVEMSQLFQATPDSTPWSLAPRSFRRRGPAWQLPAEAWQLVAELLLDQELSRSSSCCKALKEAMDSHEQWLQRAIQQFRSLPISEMESRTMQEEVLRNGRKSYISRRTLFKGKRVALLAGRSELPEIYRLARWCGAAIQLHVTSADLVLIGWGGAMGSSGTTLAVDVLGGIAIRPGHKDDSPAEFGCYAPRLLEGLLLSTSRGLVTKDGAVTLTAQLLGAECTEELTRSHTHLIAGTAQGEKYDYAIQHHIPVVSVGWIDQTLRLGLPMKERCFPVSRAGD
ncbi:Hypothetical protein SCF082_LOCUS47576 [Durusdinium trenchii]|uniref:BRCT domain-containing protein n=1 Tax=Durusdinium trenchii TaxID=1381693 RepID=A0ABP0RQ87_9DINO